MLSFLLKIKKSNIYYLNFFKKTTKTKTYSKKLKKEFFDFEESSFDRRLMSNLEIVLSMVNKVYGSHFRFYKNQGFRKYNIDTGSWSLLSLHESKFLICEAIKSFKQMDSRVSNAIHVPKFWDGFLDWYTITETEDLPEKKSQLLGFKNGTLDLKDMILKKKCINNHCFQSIETLFEHKPPNDKVINFFMKISSYNILTLNLLRAMIKLTLINKNLGVIFYLFGTSTSGKTTLFKYLKFLTCGNAVNLNLTSWGKVDGKVKAHGGSFYFFENCDSRDFSEKIKSDLINICSNTSIQLGNTAKFIKDVQIFMEGHAKFTYQRKTPIPFDDRWNDTLLVIPLSEKFDFYQESLTIPKEDEMFEELIKNTSGIVGWAMAMPEKCLLEIAKNAKTLNQDLDSFFEDDEINWFVLEFFIQMVRIDSIQSVVAGHARKENKSSLHYAFLQFLENVGVVIPKGRFVVQNAFKRAFVTLKIDHKVTKVRRGHGLVYKGLTLNPLFGKPIKSSLPKVLTLLRDTPVFSWASQNSEINSFEINGFSKNSDINNKSKEL